MLVVDIAGLGRAAGGGPTKWDVGRAEMSRCEEMEHEIDASSTQFPKHTYDAEESALLALLWWGCGGGELDSFGGGDLDGLVTLGHPSANYPPKQNPTTMDSPFPPPVRLGWILKSLCVAGKGTRPTGREGTVAEDGWSRGVGATRLGQSGQSLCLLPDRAVQPLSKHKACCLNTCSVGW